MGRCDPLMIFFWNVPRDAGPIAQKFSTGFGHFVQGHVTWGQFLTSTWPQLDLTLVQIWQRAPPLNSTSQMTHKTSATRAVFSYDGLTWPDIDLDLHLALVSYLHDIFMIPSVAFWKSLGWQLSLVWSLQPIRQRRSVLTFDLALTRHLTLLRKF